MMIINTVDHLSYAVDLKRRELQSNGPGKNPLKFDKVCGVYVGSPCVEFCNLSGDVIFTTAEVVSVDNDPRDAVTGEEGNVVFHTGNSSYEVNQEQRLIRRLAGINPATGSQGLDGDWQSYTVLELVEGRPAVIQYASSPVGRYTFTSRVRKIDGTFVVPAEPETMILPIKE